ncbi:NUDIX domain-containing protein [Candidatus Uhrbacteria bacterium]|nr:NUDIX domain-containing protein [Candidatus Uhrbacteria bacterium]
MVRRTISLFLYLPKTNEVVLSRRRENQSYPGLFQSTAHGNIEEGEDEPTALARELKEETSLVIDRVEDLRRISTRSMLTVTSKQPVVTFFWVGAIDGRAWNSLKPTAEVSEFYRLTPDQYSVIRKYSQYKDASRSFFFREPTMFDDEREVLGSVFAQFSRTSAS